MQKQLIPINKSTENKLVKIIVVSLLSIYFFIIHHGFINNASTFCNNFTNQFIFYKLIFYSINIDLVYTTCHIDIHKYPLSQLIIPAKSSSLRIYKYHYSKFVYYCILMNLIGIRIYKFHYELHLTSSKNCKLSYLLS